MLSESDSLTPTDEERVNVQACYAVAMHLHANRKVGKAAAVFFGLAIVAALVWESYWYFLAALVLSVVTYFIVIESCVRFINRSIGMPPEIQALFSKQYKSDPEFARQVDGLYKSTRRPT